jgi:hypothetical protein
VACSGAEIAELGSLLGDGPGELAEVVLALRSGQPSFGPTLLSAWQGEGRELSPALALELEAARARAGFYRSVDAGLVSKVAGLTPVKGLEIAGLYPAGLARHMNDLDYVAEAEAVLWQACGLLTGDGWELDTATFCQFGGGAQVMVSLRRPHQDPFALPYGIELSTYYSIGNYGAIRPLTRLPGQWAVPAVKNILMLLYERYEQPFRARDLVDAVLLHGALAGAGLAVLHRAVITLCLGVEYGELIDLTARAGLGPLPPWPGRRRAAALIRARRAARGAGFYLRPLAGAGRTLQRRLITGQAGRLETAAWDALQRHLPVPAALSGGLLAFGLPIDGPPPPVTGTVLHRRGDLAWADTPIARFLLTIGDYVTQDHVDQLTTRPPPPPGTTPAPEPRP